MLFYFYKVWITAQLAQKLSNIGINKIDFSVNFSNIHLFQYEYAEFLSNRGVPQSHWDVRCKGSRQNSEIQGA